MAVAIVARQVAAELVLQIDRGDVVAAACGDGEGRRQIETVGCVITIVLVLGLQTHGRGSKLLAGCGVLGGVDEQTRGQNQECRIDDANFGARIKVDECIVERRARREVVVMAADGLMIRDLQCGAASVGTDPLEVVFPDRDGAPVGNVGQRVTL